jgi:hypothetical protein
MSNYALNWLRTSLIFAYPRTKLCDHTADVITLDDVERIVI